MNGQKKKIMCKALCPLLGTMALYHLLVKCLLVLLLLVSYTPCLVPVMAKGRPYYDCLYNNSCLRVRAVSLSDTATVLALETSGKANASFMLTSNTVLVDEEGVNHPILRTIGARLDEPNRLPHDGRLAFLALFDVLPEHTAVFDLVDAGGPQPFALYGIHLQNKGLKVPCARDLASPMARYKEGRVRLRIGGFHHIAADTVRVLYTTRLSSQFNAFPIDSQLGECVISFAVDAPVLAELFVGKWRIPFYADVDEDVSMRIVMHPGKGALLQRIGKTGGVACENLFSHLPPLIHATWNDLTCNQTRMESDYFVERAFELEASNMALCDYFAWKYNFTPLEVTLLKNRQRILLAEELMLLASRLFQSKVEVPRWSEPTKADFIDYDYTMYKVAGVLPFDNPLLGIDCYFNRVLGSIRLIWPMFYWSQYAYYDSGQQINAQTVIKEITLQIDELRRLVGFKGIPWLVQAYYAKVHSPWYEMLRGGTGQEQADEFLSSMLTDGYLSSLFRSAWSY